MADDLKPALTAEEWEKGWVYSSDTPHAESGEHVHRHANDPDGVCVASYMHSGCTSDPKLKHALAALCLYQQPFGFTQEDIQAVQVVLTLRDVLNIPIGDPAEKRLRSLAHRIASLLPPTP